MIIELAFPTIGNSLPADHGYPLYASLSRLLPSLHSEADGFAIGPILGQYAGDGKLVLTAKRACLRLRLNASDVGNVIALAGKRIVIAGHALRLGVPTVHALAPAPALMARLVTIKGFEEPESFLAAARRQLDELHIAAEVSIPVVLSGPHAGEPRRRILRIKDKRVVGFTVHVTGLNDDDSLKLQATGIGGRRKMGCGFFVPLPTEEDAR